MKEAHNESSDPFGLKFSSLETMLTDLVGGTRNVIVSRFRKLRPKFASDGLLTETGNRISYDLTRVVAICAIYELNALSIPQGYAVDIVVANWPEIARSSLTAWHGAIGARSSVGSVRSPIVRLHIDALNQDPREGSWASCASDVVPEVPYVSMDSRPMVDLLLAIAEQSGQSARLAEAFGDLKSTFGWESLDEGDPERLPRRKESDFFGTGPYFERARALLAVEPIRRLHSRQAARLQALLGYLEMPAPIDSWKRFIGTEPNRPRLVHMLAAWGIGLGLESGTIGNVEVLRDISTDRTAALDLVRRGEQHVAKLVEEATA